MKRPVEIPAGTSHPIAQRELCETERAVQIFGLGSRRRFVGLYDSRSLLPRPLDDPAAVRTAEKNARHRLESRIRLEIRRIQGLAQRLSVGSSLRRNLREFGDEALKPLQASSI